MLEQSLIATAALAAIMSVSLTIYLLALKLVAWDLVPNSALPHITWWRRHARTCLLASLAITVTALAAMLLLD
jgi:hypothetical protein